MLVKSWYNLLQSDAGCGVRGAPRRAPRGPLEARPCLRPALPVKIKYIVSCVVSCHTGSLPRASRANMQKFINDIMAAQYSEDYMDR